MFEYSLVNPIILCAKANGMKQGQAGKERKNYVASKRIGYIFRKVLPAIQKLQIAQKNLRNRKSGLKKSVRVFV